MTASAVETAGGVQLVDTPGRPARPIRFADPARNAPYWARIDANVDSAPPLSDEQRAVIRTAFTTSHREAA
ncbi:hypothetical protein [Streptomyces acidiscabies]|uniref:hypothetical protein n=1 Tax=Streptomyces acidiscabies TaxID=42234 RepID=UPI0009522884|nr:hypothetical protein [Streptomyces acidiscabies]